MAGAVRGAGAGRVGGGEGVRLLDVDIEGTAIDRIRAFCPPEGYYVAFSGGKDSIVALDLVKRSGVPYDAHYSRAMEPPEVTHCIRECYPEVVWHKPKKNFRQLCLDSRAMMPTRLFRFCCAGLKETGGAGRVVVTGVRRDESVRRAKRRMTEICLKDKSKTFLHPIIDWTTEDVWAYIRAYNLPYPSLYDEGHKRVGCVMCPMAGVTAMCRDAERWPNMAMYYYDTVCMVWQERNRRGLGNDFCCPDEMWQWWTGAEAVYPQPEPEPEGQELFVFD